ncbi:MAG: heavy metal-binding domain-containing protein [Planctomycetales bacterium]
MWRVARVRLRFVLVLLAAFLIVGMWGTLRVYWDALTHRLRGRTQTLPGISDDTEYFCPMDPGVLSDWPAICPVCNMDLVRRKKGEATVLPEGVVARMQFSPYRIQLAGIKTALVRRRALAREVRLGGRLIAVPIPADEGASRLPEGADRSPAPMLECPAFPDDLPYLTPGRQAQVTLEGSTTPLRGTVADGDTGTSSVRNSVRIALAPGDGPFRWQAFAHVRIQIPLLEIETYRKLAAEDPRLADEGWLAIPETAVVATGGRRVVYVETMPGMFDGVEVQLGPRCGDEYPVLAGLDAGQKVATIGAFLIDAEARLNPSLAASYFGASRSSRSVGEGASRSVEEHEPTRPAWRSKKKQTESAPLSAADQALADRQKVCPVTDLPLDSMGGPIPVEVAGRRVFICCRGCEGPLKKDPDKFLAKIPAAP